MNSKLIAPCGMNCSLCIGFLRDKNTCPGCRNQINSNYCKKCIIKNCKILKKNNSKYCSDKCDKYPCTRLKNLDKRYRSKYEFSMIENLKFIKNNGIRKFIKKQKAKYQNNNKIYCIHRKEYHNIK